MPSSQPYRVTAVTVAAIIALIGTLEITTRADSESASIDLIQRIVANCTKNVALRAIRELRAGTQSGKHLGWMQVETVVSSSGGFSWTVLDEGGSERTRNKVFRELLEAEAQEANAGRDEGALTSANYDFGPATKTVSGQLELQLVPRRRDERLVNGTLTVAPDGSPVLLRGQLAKSPSFWVKSVSIVKRFERFDGVSLPTTVESLADLKMFGQASFTMRYRYSEVNGRTVHQDVAEVPAFGPSAQLLALHAAVSQ
jgi:hypothetical protein